MKNKFRKAVALTFLTVMLGGTVAATPVFANDVKAKCNSGGGNNSETDPANDCDPGNSAGHNNGKD